MTEAVAKHTPSHPAAWWGPRELECQQTLKIDLEGLRLAITRHANEWGFFYDQPGVRGEPPAGLWQQQLGTIDPDEYKNMARFMFRNTHASLNIVPALADRPVISSPTTPLNVPPEEEVTLFVSSPVWLQVYSEAGVVPLLDIPIQRASDTWFGPSSRSGELCYASRTHGHLSLDNVPLRPHRAITPVIIRNRADTNLLLERISLPAPNLSLYVDADGQLWTETITLERESDGDMASLEIDKQPPALLKNALHLNEPRSRLHKSSLAIRAFSVLFD
ncbi:MAG: DUF432 domain-containing protein [Pseudomonadota bacterium]|nr:DUF432 domain-containing protein [Pseudomonadota bacterium]